MCWISNPFFSWAGRPWVLYGIRQFQCYFSFQLFYFVTYQKVFRGLFGLGLRCFVGCNVVGFGHRKYPAANTTGQTFSLAVAVKANPLSHPWLKQGFFSKRHDQMGCFLSAGPYCTAPGPLIRTETLLLGHVFCWRKGASLTNFSIIAIELLAFLQFFRARDSCTQRH